MQTLGIILGIVAGVFLATVSNWLYDLAAKAGWFPKKPRPKHIIVVLLGCLPLVVLVALGQLPEREDGSIVLVQNFDAPDYSRSSIEGFDYEALRSGAGPEPRIGDTVVTHYVGMLEDGTVIDSTYDWNSPFSYTFGSGAVIHGFEMGIARMKEGGRSIITIPPSLAYGDTHVDGIPANSTVIFEVELLEVMTP